MGGWGKLGITADFCRFHAPKTVKESEKWLNQDFQNFRQQYFHSHFALEPCLDALRSKKRHTEPHGKSQKDAQYIYTKDTLIFGVSNCLL